MLMLITELQNHACCYDTCSDGVLPAVGAAASTLAFETLLSTECSIQEGKSKSLRFNDVFNYSRMASAGHDVIVTW